MSQALRLDRTRKHSTVHGEVEHGLAYYQDGLPFNAGGELIAALVRTPEQKATLERKMRKAQKKPAAETQPAQTDTQPSDTADDDAPTDEDVNFDAWARGLEKVEWTTLQRVGRKRFSKTFKSKEDLIEFLVFDEKILPLEDVAPSLRPKAD
jgi:hypothetical protein